MWCWDGACVFVRRYLGAIVRVEVIPAISKKGIAPLDLGEVYLYQYRASCMTNNGVENIIPYNETVVTSVHNNLHPPSLPPRQERNKTSSKRSQRRKREPLTLLHVQRIISFLSSTKILQESPRILGQHRSIDSKLIPTVEFLKKLYGDMDVLVCEEEEEEEDDDDDSRSSFDVVRDGDSDAIAGNDTMGSKRGMFYEAISRNTNLLLVRGVGYAGGGDNGNWMEDANDDIDGNIGNSNSIIQMEEYLRVELGITSRAVLSKLKEDHPT
jgi:hypothetical protein